MCQLLGMNAKTPTDAMFSFTGLATRADEHKDGFGIAFFEDRGLRLFVDQHSARQSPVAELVKGYPIRSDNVIAHIRKATQGRIALENTHPFVRELWGRYWVFADSEHAFCWLMQELSKAHAGLPAIDELGNTLSELLPQLHRHGTFNMLLSNGKALWAHCSTHLHYVVREHPFGAPVLADKDLMVDFAPHTGSNDRVAIVATEPLTRNEPWEAMSPGQLMTFTAGAVATRQCAELQR
jgi:predicted glutamine amidotransferase